MSDTVIIIKITLMMTGEVHKRRKYAPVCQKGLILFFIFITNNSVLITAIHEVSGRASSKGINK